MSPLSIFLFICLVIVTIEADRVEETLKFLDNFGEWLVNNEQERRQHLLGIDHEMAFKTIFQNKAYSDILAEWKTLKRVCKEDENTIFDFNYEPHLKKKTCQFLIPSGDELTEQEYDRITKFLDWGSQYKGKTPVDIVTHARYARTGNYLNVLKDWNKLVLMCNAVYDETMDTPKLGPKSKGIKQKNTCVALSVPHLPPEER